MPGRKPQWPFVREELQSMMVRGELFSTMADLASRLQVSSRTIHKAIHSDPRLRKWSQGGTKLARVTRRLLELQASDVTRPSMRQFAREFGCSFSTVRKAIYQDVNLRRWWQGGDITLTPEEEEQMIRAIRRARTDSEEADLLALTDQQWVQYFAREAAKRALAKPPRFKQKWLSFK
jgi:AraC-like DNA-binding protein